MDDADFYRALSERAMEETYRNAENAARNAPRLTPEGRAFFEHYFYDSGGRWGTNATRVQNVTLAQMFKDAGYQVLHGGGESPEEWFPGPGGGTKGGTFVDITVKMGNETIRIQTVTTDAKGNITPAEWAAAKRIWSHFPKDKLILVRKAPKPSPPPPIPQKPPNEVRAQ